MKGIRIRFFAVMMLALMLTAVIGTNIKTADARGAGAGLSTLQKDFVRLNKETSPAVVAVVRGKVTWAGFFISKDGLLLTTNEVVTGGQSNAMFRSTGAQPKPNLKAIKLHILFANGESRNAEVLGMDSLNEVALIKVKLDGKEKFTPLKLGTSKDLKPGQFVATIGNSYASINNDNQPASSMGTISGLFRLKGVTEYKGNLIESSAAVNPGTTGGPMINLKGEVIGVACKHYALSRFQGTAVPIDQIKLNLAEMKQDKAIVSGYFGATFNDTKINKVDANGPAQKAGMKKGDTIVEIDGVFVTKRDDISMLLGRTPGGTTTNIFVKRGKKTVLLTVTYGKGIAGKEIVSFRPWIGLKVGEKRGRVVIASIQPNSPAAKAGLKPDIYIISIDGKAIKNIAQFNEILKKIETGQVITIRVETKDGWKKNFKITVGEHAEN